MRVCMRSGTQGVSMVTPTHAPPKTDQTHTGKDLFFLELVQRGRIHACACMLVGPFAVPSRHL